MTDGNVSIPFLICSDPRSSHDCSRVDRDPCDHTRWLEVAGEDSSRTRANLTQPPFRHLDRKLCQMMKMLDLGQIHLVSENCGNLPGQP